ncbi:MAG TPA: NAD(+) synthase [Clostridiales bacterium]|nr:NAD(+) synthase [Clostridiales bacterium]HOL91697.1 NAD(+) synthase [Clostridiales bacterium]HPP35511.1 NAD(+) synthase [Clostridiales bacterium]
MKHGFVRVAAAVPELKVGACSYNTGKISEMIREAENAGVEIIVFPELSITAYTCADLFQQDRLLRSALDGLEKIARLTGDMKIVVIAGLPLLLDNQLFDCAAVIQGGEILGVIPKTYIPGYSEFYEERWFASARNAQSDHIELLGRKVPFGTDLLFVSQDSGAACFGVEICEDLWIPVPPSSYLAAAGAAVIFNLSASNEVIGKTEYRRDLVRMQSGRCIAGYVYASSGVHESTTDVVFGGHALIAENGGVLCESERFRRDSHMIMTELDIQRLMNNRIKNTSYMDGVSRQSFRKIPFTLYRNDDLKLTRHVDPHPFIPADKQGRDERCREIFAIQTAGLAKRLEHTGIEKAVIGISGGLDSTLAMMVTAKAFDMLRLPRKNILAITMPGFGTTDITHDNAVRLINSLGAEFREINIVKACMQHFEDIGHDPSIHDVTYENVQARERTQILMDVANKINGLVIGTGDLSELALGWCTYNGDHMSMYAVNCGIPKTLVRHLVRYVAESTDDTAVSDVLLKILDTPVTPELLPPDKNGEIRQKTEDIIGPYELHDFFIYHMLRYGASPAKILYLAEHAFEGRYDTHTILTWLKVFIRRFFSQQFKRSCLPDGPKVGTISLSPRGDWRMPSDVSAEEWLRELDALE